MADHHVKVSGCAGDGKALRAANCMTLFFKVSFMDLLTFQHSKHISPFLLLFHPYLHMKQIREREEKLDAQKYL